MTEAVKTIILSPTRDFAFNKLALERYPAQHARRAGGRVMAREASELAHRLAREAEAVCRHYLSNGRRHGRYWLVGDAHNAPGRSMFVRLKESLKRPAGTEYVAPRVMLRICDWVLSHRRLTASTQQNASALREVA